MNLEALWARLKEFISGTEFVTTSYLAGGCVRDWLMGKVSTDLDITVELDQGGIRLAEYLAALPGFTAFHKYPEFGTAKLKWGDK
ncbi:MAG TPA: CCA tRNA nucleotidyltransferase, partial [Candidatus Cloacimonadota bacterium]|nr:CCA tRNA nucleotidyltransferase [Candidatus Cloacimonadota bacterium]